MSIIGFLWLVLLRALRSEKGVVVTGPCMSVTARGTYADTITFSKIKGVQYAKTWFKPANPQTGLQTNMRLATALAVAYIQVFTGAQLDAWKAYAQGTGMNWFAKAMEKALDAYIAQLGTATTPVSVTVLGDPPADVWTWT